MTKVAAAFTFFIVAVSASASWASPLPLHSDKQIIDYTDRVIRLNKLSSNPGCLQYSADTSVRRMIYVKVFEIHHATCGGDPQTKPLLFTIRYNLKDNSAATDKGSISNSFHRIRTASGQ